MRVSGKRHRSRWIVSSLTAEIRLASLKSRGINSQVSQDPGGIDAMVASAIITSSGGNILGLNAIKQEGKDRDSFVAEA